MKSQSPKTAGEENLIAPSVVFDHKRAVVSLSVGALEIEKPVCSGLQRNIGQSSVEDAEVPMIGKVMRLIRLHSNIKYIKNPFVIVRLNFFMSNSFSSIFLLYNCYN